MLILMAASATQIADVLAGMRAESARLISAGAPVTQHRFARPRGETPWIRLARRAERAKAALVVVGDRPLVGTVAAVALAAERGRVRWLGGERGAPRILDGVRGRIAVVRSKLGPPVATTDVPLALAR